MKRSEEILFIFFSIQSASSLLPEVRPAEGDRKFVSPVIDELITTLKPLFANPDLGIILSNCLPNTLDTTVYSYTPANYTTNPPSSPDSFIITGDIEALWLRDSMNQVLPYIPYAPFDSGLEGLIEGLIARQARSLLIDPYANAFNYNESGAGHQGDTRTPPMTGSVFEGKYELDSTCAMLRLSYWHWRYSGDDALLRFAATYTDTSNDKSSAWLSAVGVLLETVGVMQRDDGQNEVAPSPYLFQRETTEAMDTLPVQGRGPPCSGSRSNDGELGSGVGLSRSLFRPSDDAVSLPYHIPGNAMACVELTHLQSMLSQLFNLAPSPSIAAVAASLLRRTEAVGRGICDGLSSIISSAQSQSQPLPYEVDGFGSSLYMDDANVPSLLSLPLLGLINSSHPVYASTRARVLSRGNPYFFHGPAGEGVGGPHVGPGRVWPLAIMIRALTVPGTSTANGRVHGVDVEADAAGDAEIERCLKALVGSSAGTGLMHESFSVEDASDYTRAWFAWANGQMGELLLVLMKTRPHLVLRPDISPDELRRVQAAVQTPVALMAQYEHIF